MPAETPRRTFRVHDTLWEAAHQKAADHGQNLSAVLRQALHDYVTDNYQPAAEGEQRG